MGYRCGLIVEQSEGGHGIIIFASYAAANKWREAFEDRVETYGIIPIVDRVETALQRVDVT